MDYSLEMTMDIEATEIICCLSIMTFGFHPRNFKVAFVHFKSHSILLENQFCFWGLHSLFLVFLFQATIMFPKKELYGFHHRNLSIKPTKIVRVRSRAKISSKKETRFSCKRNWGIRKTNIWDEKFGDELTSFL